MLSKFETWLKKDWTTTWGHLAVARRAAKTDWSNTKRHLEIARKWTQRQSTNCGVFLARHWFSFAAWMVVIAFVSILLYCVFSPFGADMRKQSDDYFIALFTIVLGGGAIIQGMYLARQDSRLKVSIDDARFSNEMEMRAYLSLERNDTGMRGFSCEGTTYRWQNNDYRECSAGFRYHLVNRGKTPAYNLKIKMMIERFKKDDDDAIEKFVTTIKDSPIIDASMSLPVLSPGAVEFFNKRGAAHWFLVFFPIAPNSPSLSLKSPISVAQGAPNLMIANQKAVDDYVVVGAFKVEYIDAFNHKRTEMITQVWKNLNNDVGDDIIVYPHGVLSS